jgi:hypothetical protein
LAEEIDGLKKEWGAAYDKHVAQAQRAAKAFGVDEEKSKALIQSLGFQNALKLFHEIGAKIGEPDFVDGQGSGNFNGALAPAQAKAEIGRLMADPDFTKALFDKRHPAHGEMQAKRDRLYKMAYPD